MRLLTQEENDEIWARVIGELQFCSFATVRGEKWMDIPVEHKVYHLPEYRCWSEEQEKIVNSIFKQITDGNLYALDWQHDSFLYSPHEDIGYFCNYYDEDRNCQVYFPEYYPNGDFHFFMDENRRFGMFGNPFNHELIVYGDELIKRFDEHLIDLEIILTGRG